MCMDCIREMWHAIDALAPGAADPPDDQIKDIIAGLVARGGGEPDQLRAYYAGRDRAYWREWALWRQVGKALGYDLSGQAPAGSQPDQRAKNFGPLYAWCLHYRQDARRHLGRTQPALQFPRGNIKHIYSN